MVGVGYSPEWRWVKRPKRGGFGSVVELVGIGVMLGTPRGAERDAKQQAIVACAWLFGRRKGSARSFTLFMPAGIMVVAWRCNGHKKGSG